MSPQYKNILASYKKFLLPAVLILLCFMILLFVIIPQISVIGQKQDVINSQNEEVSTLKSSENVVAASTGTDVDDNLETVTMALPTQKDVSSIFDALTNAASVSDTTLGTFSVNVGGVYGRAANTPGIGVPSITVTAHIQSQDPRGLVEFAQALSKSLPLSEVKKINISGSDGVFEIDFFYKPVDTASVAKQDNVAPLSSSDKNLLNTLSSWKQ